MRRSRCQRTARETIVQVENENRKPVAGAVVVFRLPSQGAGGTFANGAAAGISAKTVAIILAVAGTAAAGGRVAATRGGGGESPPGAPTRISAGAGSVGHP